MRRRLPWLVALPLMAAGSLAAHSLSYLVVAARAEGEAGESAERSSSGAAGHSVTVLAVVATIVAAYLVNALVARARGQRRRGASPWLFFALPPLAFLVQEVAERLLRAEAVPFSSAAEPRFLIGFALQLPLGLVALLVARLLLRVAERIILGLRPLRPSRLGASGVIARLRVFADLPRLSALAVGYSERGPPPG